MQYLIKQKLSN